MLNELIQDEIVKLNKKSLIKIMKKYKLNMQNAIKYKNKLILNINKKYKNLSELETIVKLLQII